ncbi:hypothetical protein MIMGU_mgv1a023307mg [Erythranthe guttata]|uniref:Protein FAR1-RELATED SEQUENCE n=1 Tax=Erythranthe guttata TaxID=4155 RepID=A0A022PUK3_ERYGU|nr:hypothetical protein MIMGU_mgv1a023307mg [Erythranthe guttata]
MYIISGHRNLFWFYLEHAKHRGFDVIKRTTRKTADGENKYLLMTCDKSRKTALQKTMKRVDCPARVSAIKQCDGNWMVSSVVAGHNHELTSDISILMPAHINISTNMKRQLEANDIAGIMPWCLPKDCRNFIEGRRKLRLGTCNGEAIRKLFWGLQKWDTNFIYSLDIDDHGRLCNMLWIYSRCRAAYAEFNDNKIDIRELMPSTIHRYCLWHIMSKVPQKFKGVAEYNNVVRGFKRIVYESITSETFELKWGWVPCYLNHVFGAGMLWTQRSEGMYAFNRYIHSRSTLKQFVEQYELAMANKIQKEFIAKNESKNMLILCLSQFPWERQFQSAYTNNLFKKVQEEISRVLYCHIVVEQYDQTSGVEKISVHAKSRVNEFYTRDFTFIVDYTTDGEYFSCNCKKFEFMGLLCCHILFVLRKKDIQSVSKRYLLRRWMKDIYRRHSSIFFAGGYPHMPEE